VLFGKVNSENSLLVSDRFFVCWGFDNLPADLEETWLGYVSVSVWANVVVKLRGARYFS